MGRGAPDPTARARRSVRSVAALAALAALATLASVTSLGEGRARATSREEVTGGSWLDFGASGWLAILGGAAVGGLDAGLATHAASTHGPQSKGWAITEASVNVPLSGLATYALVRWGGERDVDRSWSMAFSYPMISALLGLPAGLATHGIWTAANGELSSGRTFSVSYAIGVDSMLTAHTLGRTLSGRLLPAPLGLGEALTATPIAIVASVYAARDPAHRTEWGLLAGWSGALVLHGLASVIVDGADAPAKASAATVSLRPLVGGARGPAPGVTLEGAW